MASRTPPIECLRLLPLPEQITPCPRLWCFSIHAAAQAAEGGPCRNRENLSSSCITLQPDLRLALHRAIRHDSKIQP
jgi:hypothetical protein